MTPTSSSGLVLAIVPARGGSKGVPDKNIRLLAGRTLLERTASAGKQSGVIDRMVLSTDSETIAGVGRDAGLEVPFMRPSSLAQDDTPMLAVVRHAVDEISRAGWDAEFIVLLQPTSPLRTPDHIRNAVTMLRGSAVDSVVSVVELPRHLSPDYVMRIEAGALKPFLPEGASISRRQDARPAFSRDGTVYAFRRRTLERFGNIYGEQCQPLVIDPAESLSIDSPADWSTAEHILTERERERAGTAGAR